VRVLGAEGGAKGVHIGKSAAVVLHRELSADSQKRRLAEEVLCVIDLTILALG